MTNEACAKELPVELDRLTQLARDALGRMTAERCARGDAALQQRLSRTRRVWFLPSLAVVAAAALASGVVVAGRHRPTRHEPLSFSFENDSTTPVNTSLDVDSGPPRVVRFSDGTELHVDQGTQGRIRSVTERGAAISLSRGSLHAAVVHSSTSEWRFDAGPFEVLVTGTAFGLSWDPAHDQFDLRLERGSVTVASPVANDPIPVRAGQWLTIRPRSNEVFIRELPPDGQEQQVAALDMSDTARAPTSAPADSAQAPTPPTPPTPPRSPPVGHDWAQDLARGNADRIVDDATTRGLDDVLARSSSRELSALADAARYTRRDAVARRALLAERRRFPGSHIAIEAGLLLGRLAEAEHDHADGLRWFDTYLSEAPTGARASEALGRKMALVRRLSGAAAARAVANEYLARYPNGTYAAAAKALSSTP